MPQETKEKDLVVNKGNSLISTTEKIENRLDVLRRNGLNNVLFTPDSIDLYRKHDCITLNGQKIYEGILGFNRFFNNPRYITDQINWIRKAILNQHPKRVRYLTILPGNYQNYDALRNALINIQISAGLPEKFVFVEKDETANAIQIYSNNLENKDNCVLVLDEDMEEVEFTAIINWGINIFKEIVIMYRNWEKNITKYFHLLSLSTAEKQKIHFARIPLSINQYTSEDLISTILIAEKFKSVSFKDLEIPPAMLKNIKNKPIKTQQQKMITGSWVDIRLMDYVNNHPAYCNCLGGMSIIGLGVDNCITYHDMEKLTETYVQMIRRPIERQRVLNLNSMQPMVRELGIVI